MQSASAAAFRFDAHELRRQRVMMGKFATVATIAEGLLWLALSFFLIAPIILFFPKETTRKELTDVVGQKIVA
jgi:hypothetical protein